MVSAVMVYFLIIKYDHAFSMYMSLSIITKATPLSKLRSIQLSSFLRLCRAFLYSFVMLEKMGLGLALDFVRTFLTLA